jgi:hypothetical protein
LKAQLRLKTLTVEPRGSGADFSVPLKPAPFNPGALNYNAEVNNNTNGIWIGVELASTTGGHYLSWDIEPHAMLIDEPREGVSGTYFEMALPKYMVTITARSGTPELLDDTPYTVIITKQGYYSLNVPPDEGKGQVRVVNGDGDPVGNADPGTALTLTVRPNLGYGIGTATCTKTGAAPSHQEPITLTDANNDGVWEYPFTTDPAGLHYTFNVTYSTVAGVANVAYVSGQGRKTGAYVYHANYDEGTATSWGTASNDLQEVINSWTGPGGNFDEIWVHGTVTPKTRARVTVDGETWEIPSSAITPIPAPTEEEPNPKQPPDPDLAFVIPPGLKIYGGFNGTETALGQRSTNNRLTVLSGAQDDDVSSYHVVIMADIPDDGGTILDGLTITGGLGMDGPDTITVKTYSIDKQSGAGIYLVNASPVLNNVRIQKNTATANGTGNNVGGGGGLYNLAANGGISSPRLTGTVISGNSVLGNGPGGGIYNRANANSTASPLLDGVTIELNQSSSSGGGMYNYGATDTAVCAPDIKNSRIVRNAATSGAGVYNHNYSAPKFTHVVFEKNTAGSAGGAVNSVSNSRPEFDHVRIEANLAGSTGGGIQNSAYTKIMNTTIAGNTSSGYGGGIFSNGKGLELVNATLSGNQAASYAGGIYIAGSGVVMSNVKIENNRAPSGGGGIWIEHYRSSDKFKTALFISNGIIRGNTTGGGGGGIYVSYSTPYDGSEQLVYLSLTNVLVAGNTASQGGGISLQNGASGSGAGYGIKARLTNVTIAGNTATSEGGGLYTKTANGSDSNKVAVSVYNSIIWGNGSNNIQDASGRNTYDHSLVQGLTRHDDTITTGASKGYTEDNGNFVPTNWSDSTPPLASNYALSDNNPTQTYLVNGGSNTAYNFLETATSALGIMQDGTSIPTIINNLDETLCDRMVKDMVSRLGSDATAAESTGDAPPSGTGNTRIKNDDSDIIDVGAYEKQ